MGHEVTVCVRDPYNQTSGSRPRTSLQLGFGPTGEQNADYSPAGTRMLPSGGPAWRSLVSASSFVI
jgi:hypothetical protein